MFWIGVKVLLLRQLYGLKHRWVITVFSVAMPVLLLSFFHVGRLLSSTASLKTSDQLQVKVMAGSSSDAEKLINEAHRILRLRDNSSSPNIRLEFTEDAEEMSRLWESNRPSIGIQFDEISKGRLEYTLHSSHVVSRGLDLFWLIPIGFRYEELSREVLELQNAIDTAYIRKYVPGHGYLRLHFPSSSFADERDDSGEGGRRASPEFVQVCYVGTAVSNGLILVMTVLATYVTRDKLSGIRELLCINGMPRWMTTLSWLFSFSFLSIVISLCQLLLLTLPSDKVLLPDVSPLLLALLLILYGWSALIFSNFVANLLNSQPITILMVCLYWFVTSIFGWLLAISLETWRVRQAFLSLLPNFGFSMFLAIAELTFHEKHSTLSFGNLFSTPDPEAYVSPGLVLVLIVISMLLFLALVFYLDVVKPGPYGRARPWYLYKRRNLATVRPADAPQPDEAFVIQEIEEGAPIGLKCVNIVKMYGTHAALRNVNLTILKNSITILLGHNGAGKTTLFSILSGMFSPTSGEVYTEEFNIFQGSNLKTFRSVLGYCPQKNLLLKELTVREHLIIFGMLKGLTKSKAGEHGDEWMEKFSMTSMGDTPAKKLSGGFKRKLCLAIAMTGKPKYLLLDEPSAGLDIESTRVFCDLMLEEKGNCTVVITTHNLDEADILGDRIAILAEGQVRSYGESWFLKERLDTGIRLSCTATGADTREIIDAVQMYVDSAAVLHKMNRSVTFRLPTKTMRRVPDLLRELERRFGDAVSSSLSPSTLDDVFIQVQKDLGVKVNLEDVPAMSHGSRSRCNFYELLRKKARYQLSRRMIPLIIWVVVLPCAALLNDMFMLYTLITPVKSKTQNKLFQSEPVEKFSLLPSQRDNISSLIHSALMKSGISFGESGNDSVDRPDQREKFGQSKLMLSYGFSEPETPIAYFPSRTDVSSAYSALLNALLRGNATIVTHRGFHRSVRKFADLTCPIEPFLGQLVSHSFALMVLPFFLAATAYFLVFPHKERTTLFKHLQLMTGLQPAIYWLSNLAFDMVVFAVSCILFVAIMAVFDVTRLGIFTGNLAIVAFIVVLLLYGLCSITFSYIWNFPFRANATALLLLFFTSIFLSMSAIFLLNFFPGVPTLKYVYFLPFAILWGSIANIVNWALQTKSCDLCNFKPSCQYLQDHPLFGKGLKDELICFAVFTVAYFLVLLFLDHGLGKRLIGFIQRCRPFLCCSCCCYGGIEDVEDLDGDVAFEKLRVRDLQVMEEDVRPQFICDGIGKKFSRDTTAVRDVTFTAERGECFGLVGVNGAGKSTTFSVLSALLCASKGTAIVDGRWKLSGLAYGYKKRIGYCPQSRGLLWSLSARTILRLFGRLTGIPKNQIEQVVEQWVYALDMADIAHRPCGHYSGGNQRKLSLAVALIGTPLVMLLDEPTAGVDPVVRWRIWEILTACLERNDQSIVLASHTMTECEAICNRLAIMVSGVMQCIGPIPMLKKRFGKSYILEVKLAPSSTSEHQLLVQSMIESRFDGFIELQSNMLNRLVFLLKTENVKIYYLFEEMLNIKSKMRIIEYFHLSETPLEQVFFMFAKNQSDALPPPRLSTFVIDDYK